MLATGGGRSRQGAPGRADRLGPVLRGIGATPPQRSHEGQPRVKNPVQPPVGGRRRVGDGTEDDAVRDVLERTDR